MATYFRMDGWVKSAIGPSTPGANVYVCNQPANTVAPIQVPNGPALPPFVPSPLAAIFSDVNGLSPIVQPVITDGFGHYAFYAAPGFYTVVVMLGGRVQQVYKDQNVGEAGILNPALVAGSGITIVGNVISATGGAGAVSSVFGRTGAVVAASGDYSIGQITGAVTSVFGRTGAVVATSGDYSVGQITGAAPLASPGLTGVPTAPTAAPATNTIQLATTAFVAAAVTGLGSGTVTSVSFTGGLISVATPTTTPALTVAGTSGGIPFFSGTATWASSALLAATGLVIGGGAGVAPATNTQLVFSGSTLTIGLAAAGTGILALKGTTSGVISIKGQNAAGTFNFNLPTTAGTAGQFLTSQGGVAAAMTWTTSSSVAAGSTNAVAVYTSSTTVGAATAASIVSGTLTLGTSGVAGDLRLTDGGVNAVDLAVDVGNLGLNIAAACTVLGLLKTGGFLVVSTDFPSTTTTLASITGLLAVNLLVSRSYKFRAHLFVDTSALGGAKFAMGAGSVAASVEVYQVNIINNTTSAYVNTSRQTALGGTVSMTPGPTTVEVVIEGALINVTTPGNLTVQFAQTAASGTSTVKAGSSLEVIDVT